MGVHQGKLLPLLKQYPGKVCTVPSRQVFRTPWAPSGCPASQFNPDTNSVGLAQTLRSKAQSHNAASLYFRCQSQRVGPKLLTFLSVSATNQGFPQPAAEAQWFARMAPRTQGTLCLCLLVYIKDAIKDIDEQPEGEVQRAKSTRVLSTEASVPVELEFVLLWHMDVFTNPCNSDLHRGFILRNAGLDEAQAGIKIARRNINNLSYTMTPPLWQKVKKN